MNEASPLKLSHPVSDHVENLHAPEMFATEAAFFATSHGTIQITLVSHRWDNSAQPPVPRRIVIGRLVMPVAGAQGLALGLYDYLRKAGAGPDAAAAQHASDAVG